jgi:hypothetical protein
MAQGIFLIPAAPFDERFMYATSTVWKILSLGAVAIVMWTGGHSVAAYWAVAVGQLTWLLATVIAPQPDGNSAIVVALNTLILYGPLVLFRPHRRDLLHPRLRPDRVLLSVALAGAVPLGLFAWRARPEVPSELGFDMVGLYLVLAASGLLAALRPRGTQWPARVVAIGTALVGAAAITRPEDLASPGIQGGLLLLGLALAFAVLPWTRPNSGTRSDDQPR